MTLSADEIARRRPVWEAMSALFLDAQLDADDHAGIADVLVASGYSLAELERILWAELCPVLWTNAASVAGEWRGFDMEYVQGQIVSRPAGPLRRWWGYVNGGNVVRHEWKLVRQALAARESK